MAGAPIKVLDHCRVSPPPNSGPPSPSLNLTSFDIPWAFLLDDAQYQTQQILFYQFPTSHNKNSYSSYNDIIHQEVLPSLKTSLSLALQKFYPYASKLVFPPFPEMPRILYTNGDSVPFTVAESTMDFGELIGDQIKDVKLFHPLIPKLSPQIGSSEDDGTWIIPELLAIQVTLFPNTGMSIGVHYNHTVGDGMSFMYFLKSWASICRTGSVETSLIPFLQRDVIVDANGLKPMQYWKEWSQTFPRVPGYKSPLPSYAEVRGTFNLSKTSIKRLKEWILNDQLFHQTRQLQGPTLSSNISSFAAACAFTWVCFVKSKEDQKQVKVIPGDQESCEFLFTADVRNRLKTLTPETFFGNCIVPCPVRIDKNVLLGQHGIVYAAKAISEKVNELDDDSGAVRALGTWLSHTKVCSFERLLSVAGSPRLAVYDTDFGWGRPKKCEMVHIDATGAISLAETIDEEGGLEIGVALERSTMVKFTTLFQGLDSFI